MLTVRGAAATAHAEMFRILDHECRDRHLWTLAPCGLCRGEIAGLRWCNLNLTDKPVGEGHDKLPPSRFALWRTGWRSGPRCRRHAQVEGEQSDVVAARRCCGGAEGGA